MSFSFNFGFKKEGNVLLALHRPVVIAVLPFHKQSSYQ